MSSPSSHTTYRIEVREGREWVLLMERRTLDKAMTQVRKLLAEGRGPRLRRVVTTYLYPGKELP